MFVVNSLPAGACGNVADQATGHRPTPATLGTLRIAPATRRGEPGRDGCIGVSESLTLNEAQDEYRAWFEATKRDAKVWKGNIERADHFRGVFNQFALGVLDSVGPAIAGIPVLAPALPLITGLGGLLMRRPGDTSKDDLRRQKEASYNAGLEAGKKLLA